MPYRINNKFVSKATWEAHQAELAASEENTVTDTAVEETEVKERKTRQADPLLAAKRRLEAAKKRQAKAQKKADAVQDVQAELDDANVELAEAVDQFNEAVAAVTG
jgi:hypothetical protein